MLTDLVLFTCAFPVRYLIVEKGGDGNPIHEAGEGVSS